MAKRGEHFSADFKFKVVLETLRILPQIVKTTNLKFLFYL